MRVLIVDDYVDAAASFAHVLRSHGFECRFCLDGETALGVVEEFSPAAVVIDSILPDMSGAALAIAIRERRPAVRVMGIISYPGEVDAAFDECYVKPPEIEPFIRRLRQSALR